MSEKVRALLEAEGVEYRVLPHAPAGTSSEAAEAAHVPGADFAKSVVVEAPGLCALVVVPVTEQVHLGALRRSVGAVCALATQDKVDRLFQDCDSGSVPPFGQAYGLEVLVDEALLRRQRVFVESGDRAALIALDGEDFRRLMARATPGRWSHAE